MIQKKWLSDFQLKWDRMKQAMMKIEADGCLLSVDVNLYYLTGRVYNGFFYMPAEGDPWFFVKRPAGINCDHVEYIHKPEQMAELFANNGLKMPRKLLLEADELSYNEYMRLLAVFNPELTGNATALMRNLREIKTPHEIEMFRTSARLHEKTYAEIPDCFHYGMTDRELQYEIEKRMRKNGSIGLVRAFGDNMDIFMGSILAGDNAAQPSPFDYALGGGGTDALSPVGANGTVLKKGMAIMIDMAGNYTAYMTDMTRTYSVGTLPQAAYRAHQTSILIQSEIEKKARPGVACADLYKIAANIADQEGLSPYFMGLSQQAKFIGHGIGIQINELPVLTPKSKEKLQTGMVFALEPKFVVPGTGAVGIENSFLVTETGIEKLTLFKEEIIKL